MVYYADYEALEFDNEKANAKGIYPYYLNSKITDKSLCPIYFSACDRKGNVVSKQNCFNQQVSFISFLNKEISKYQRYNNKTMYVWFHNVKYDFRIIAYELFNNGFKNIVDSQQITYIGEYDTEQEKAFAIVGENLAKYVGINLYYRGFKILIRDTMSILNSAQDKILHDFGYPKKVNVPWENIDIDNLESYMPLVEERNIYDITSLAKCIEEFKDYFYKRFHGKGSTAASMSLDALKHYLCVKGGVTNIDRDTKNDFFRECYPKLNGFAKDISTGCYHGGICTINKKYAGKVLRNLQMIDINSSYPYSMTMPLPYGEGEEIHDFTKEGYSEYVIYIEFKHTGIPFQRCHSENRARALIGLEPKEKIHTRSQFPDNFKGYLCINSIDLDTLKKHAKIKVLEFKKGINYKTNTVIKEFIEPIYNERTHSKGVAKLAIKLLLNSLYGKYAQDLSGLVFIYDSVDDYHKIQAIDNDTIYKPFASAVTAYSRQNWINTTYLIGDNFIYGDTDSIYFKNVNKCVDIFNKNNIIHESKLGKWAFDSDYGDIIIKGKFLSKKNYMLQLGKNCNKEEYPNDIKVTCVGLSKKYHEQVTFDNFIINSQEYDVYKMVNVYGGKAMRATKFKIKERCYY